MHPEIETYSRYIVKQIASIEAALAGRSETQLNRRPAIDGANSVYVVATHVLGNARAWVLGIACGQPVRRDRPGEFASSGTYADFARAAREISAQIESSLAPPDPG